MRQETILKKLGGTWPPGWKFQGRIPEEKCFPILKPSGMLKTQAL
jgi:hypothetical protein